MKMGSDHGLEVAETTLSRWPGVCVIVITGYPSLEDMRTTFKLKVFDYLSKPFSLSQLRQVLENAVNEFGLGRTAYAKFREKLGHRIKMPRTDPRSAHMPSEARISATAQSTSRITRL